MMCDLSLQVKETRTVFNQLKFKGTSVVGIDINQFGVNLIEISVHNGTHCIEGFANEILPLGAIEGNTIQNSYAVSECIKRAILKGNIHGKKAIVAIPDAAVITKIISINAGLREREIEEFIKMDSENYVPYPSHEINVDFQIVGPSINNLAMQDVRVFVSRTEKVNELVTAVSRAGLEVKVVDIESHAMQRAVQLLIKELAAEKRDIGKLDAIVALIDIGALETNLFVLQGMNIVFTREEEFGSQSLVAALAQSNFGGGNADKFARTDEMASLQPLMEVLLLQIKRMLQFFFSTSHHQVLDAIILSGEIAQLTSLMPFLQKKMGVVTSIANPLSYLKTNKNIDYQLLIETSPSMMLACGLALRQIK